MNRTGAVGGGKSAMSTLRGMLVCSSLFSVCMFIVLKTLIILSATVIVRAGEPFG